LLLRTSFPVGVLGCNCSLIACPDTREALVVDPGDEAARILDELKARDWKPVQVVHTHAHFDHLLATDAVATPHHAETCLHREDRFLYDGVPQQLAMFGMPARPAPPALTRELEGGEVLSFGRREARVIHTPGHTPGSICLYLESAGEPPLLLSGDTLFARSIGRTDLWGGSMEQILDSIRGPLLALPADTQVIPGHGRATTIGEEREENPFVGKHARL
jgi:hydroxyacylglutathione hydrolase